MLENLFCAGCPNLVRALAWTEFAVDDNGFAFPDNAGKYGAGSGDFAFFFPAIFLGAVAEALAVKARVLLCAKAADATIITAEEVNLVINDGGGSGGCGAEVGKFAQSAPASACAVGPRFCEHVALHAAILSFDKANASKNIDALTIARHLMEEATARGKGASLAPCLCAKIKDEHAAFRILLACGKAAACDVDFAIQDGGAVSSEGIGQAGHFAAYYITVFFLEKVAVGNGSLGIAAANEHESFGDAGRGAIAKTLGKGTAFFPAFFKAAYHKNAVCPVLGTTFPHGFSGEVCSCRKDEAAIACASITASVAFVVGDIWKLCPEERKVVCGHCLMIVNSRRNDKL